MRLKRLAFVPAVLLLVAIFGLNGCTFIFQKGRRVDVEKISKLKSELSDLERAKAELEERLKTEITDKDVTVEILEKGLVITFLAEVLFDSGKDVIRKESFNILDKVAHVLNTTTKNLSVGIEGHTDNVPIKYSGWKSNWELSTARALSVLHYIVDKQGIDEKRLSVIGHGEFKPVTSNATAEGRQKNRRVEIVILPEAEKKRK